MLIDLDCEWESAMPHLLSPFFSPKCLAIVGASDRLGSTGRNVFGMLASTLEKTDLIPINPQHKTIAGEKSFDSLSDAVKVHFIDTVIIILSADKVATIIREMAKLKLRHAIIINDADPTPINVANKLARASEIAKKNGILLTALPSSGLRGLFCPPSNSAAISYIGHSTSIADCIDSYAREREIGFNRFLTLNPLNYSVSTGQLIDFIAAESQTSALLVHISHIDHAQDLISSLTAAARLKPVIVLPTLADETQEKLLLQALTRNHILTVHTLMDFLSAAKLIHTGLFCRGKNVSVISNTPQISSLSIKTLLQLGLNLAETSSTTLRNVVKMLPHKPSSENPILLPSDTPPSVFQKITEAFLHNEHTDAVVLLYSGTPTTDNARVAKMTSVLQARFRKPLLLVWVGSADTPQIRTLFNQQKNLHFRQPEHAFHALMQLNDYRSHQQQRHTIADFFDYSRVAQTANALQEHVQPWLPVASLPASKNTVAQLIHAMQLHPSNNSRKKAASNCVLDWKKIEPFGQVLTLDNHEQQVSLLPPITPNIVRNTLNQLNLSHDIWEAWLCETVDLLSRLPQICDLHLGLRHDETLGLCCTEIKLNLQDPDDYHGSPNTFTPYPHFIAQDIVLSNGKTAHLRALRPEDASLLQTFVGKQSEQSRYMRFMSRFKILPPSLLARLSTPDYQRDFSVILTDEKGETLATAGYTGDTDLQSCEFGIMIDDHHQGLGIGRLLMENLIRFARYQNYSTIRAEILSDNYSMQKLALKLDFVLSQNPHDNDVVNATLTL